VIGFLVGFALGIILAPVMFPDGVATAIQRWGDSIRSQMPVH
jgi:hypothetical protein